MFVSMRLAEVLAIASAGLAATGRTCRAARRRPPIPRARAARTKSWASTSPALAAVVRTHRPASGSPSTSHGTSMPVAQRTGSSANGV
jgi:hypothetical protein